MVWDVSICQSPKDAMVTNIIVLTKKEGENSRFFLCHPADKVLHAVLDGIKIATWIWVMVSKNRCWNTTRMRNNYSIRVFFKLQQCLYAMLFLKGFCHRNRRWVLMLIQIFIDILLNLLLECENCIADGRLVMLQNLILLTSLKIFYSIKHIAHNFLQWRYLLQTLSWLIIIFYACRFRWILWSCHHPKLLEPPMESSGETWFALNTTICSHHKFKW